jgi:hypothetical protein
MIGADEGCQDDDGKGEAALKSKVIGSDRGESNERHSQVEKPNLPLPTGSKTPYGSPPLFPAMQRPARKTKGRTPKTQHAKTISAAQGNPLGARKRIARER